jgi:hydroxymethylbilane synthase
MRIGTRRSALALAQAGLVAELLAAAGHIDNEIVPMSTDGDRASAAGRDPTADGSDKSRWVTELEDALADGRIDLAVHSAKDVPGELAEGLALHGAPARAPAEDVLCGADGLEELESGARVGTSSIRRVAQLRAVREDLDVVAIRGNVDTRLRKLADREQDLDAIVLARAGLVRLGLEAQAGGVLEAITDKDAFACLLAERAVARELEASCHTPLGAYAVPAGCGCLNLRAWVGLPDGSAWVGDELLGGFYDPDALGRRVAERLSVAGAGDLLRRAEEMAGHAA